MSIFSTVKVRKPKRSTFDLSHENKLTCNIGKLIPFFCQEVLPGDSFRVNTDMLVRMAPMVAPIMQRLNVYTHFFFVPYRLLWDEWEDFITGGADGKANPPFPQLFLHSPYTNVGYLGDYLGLPTGTVVASGMNVNALPFKAYHLIWNEYYRDQNLMQDFDIRSEQSGVISAPDSWVRDLCSLRTRCWHKDYFTSALPWTQRGDDVLLPLTGDAPVILNPVVNQGQAPIIRSGNDMVYGGDLHSAPKSAGGTSFLAAKTSSDTLNIPVGIDPNGSLVADMGEVSSVTINELRRANALQRWLETNARGGSRYIEQILSHFGVRVADYRLQRPEFLGGGKSPIMISEVLQNSASSADGTPQGTMAGHGISASVNHAFKSNFYEHGLIMGIMSVLPYSSYQNGVPRLFGKFDRFDYGWPEFAHLGEQPIYNSEIFANPVSGINYTPGASTGVFGYTPRYAEYKYCPDSVHGDFRTTLNFWHMGRRFSTLPGLNADFVTCDDTTNDQVFAVTEQKYDKLWVQIYNDVRAIRPLPKYGTPGL